MELAGILNAATKLLPIISAGVGVAGQIKNLISSSSGASTNAQSGSSSNQMAGMTTSNQSSTGQTQQTTSQYGGSTGTSETIGDVGSLGSILTKALGTATGNNSGLAANFNAGQAQTANNLQTGSWTLANLMNQLNAAWQNKKLTEAATTANAFNAAEAQKNRDWQERMSNTSYQRAVGDMKKAGINPILAAQNGGANTGSGATASAAGLPNFTHAQAAAIPAAHTATMQAMYDYGNNTSQFLNNAMQTINSAKTTHNYTVANYMESIMQEVTKTSAQGVQKMAQTINNNFNNKGWEHNKTDTTQTEKGVSGKLEGNYRSKS
jgi:hypothetical protein